jgi:tetratricopeptide (TPR) repeat protein
VLIVSWLLPCLALRAGTRALAAAGDGQVAVARAEAQRSQRLDPLAVGPLITLAGVEQRAGNPRAALAALEKAAALQPDNFYVQYQLGLLLANSLGRTEAAADAFRRALELNPRHSLSQRQLELLGRD